MRRPTILLIVLLLAGPSISHGQVCVCVSSDASLDGGISHDPGRPKKPIFEKPGDRNWGDCPPERYLMHDCERAGNPHCVARWARCNLHKKYGGGYVGGGAAFSQVPSLGLLSRGRERKTNAYHGIGEGTWGVDYTGFFQRSNVWLRYTQGRKQGGEGAYRTDGEPKIVSRVKSVFHSDH
ncbi:MAG: hypothetical protein KDB27_06230 [Planctomycetales bacterium]|nr:hypothetical protein [Planctomycetales bacterium]